MGAKTIRDAIHGDIQLDALEMEVIDTDVFQRLRGIKQLGTSAMIFPSATHTRFEHSLGTCWITKHILEALRRQTEQPHLLREQQSALFLSALLHDITHIPFGHTFEDERRVFPRHDESPERIRYFLCDSDVGRTLEREGLLSLVLNVLDKKPTADRDVILMREIIAGTVCADLLDYLKRDATFCGLHLDYDERLYRYLTVQDGRLVFDLQQRGLFRPDALSEVVHLLRLRYTLTERVYFHHGKVVAGAMISRALEFALRAKAVSVEELYDLRDDSFLYVLRERGKAHADIALLLDDLLGHRFYRCVFLLRPGGLQEDGVDAATKTALEKRFHLNESGEREQVENELARRLGVRPSEVLIYCPSAKMSLKEAEVLVKLDAGSPLSLSLLRYPEVEVLLQKHRELWRFSVYLRREREALASRAGGLCEELLGQRNMLAERSRR